MKKLSIAAAIAGLCLANLNTQAQGLYAGLGVGYGFPSGLQSFTPTETTTNGSTSITSVSTSLGNGMNIGVYGGYMLSKNVGIQLGISDKLPASTTSTVTATDSASTSQDVYTAKGGMFMLTPALRLQVGDGKLQVYSVTGLIIGFPSSVTMEDKGTYTSSFFNGTSDEIWTYSGGMTIGFHGAIGVCYMVSDKIGIFGEVAANLQNWAPSQSLITTYTINGVDQLSTMTTSQKQTNYESSYTAPTAASPGSPTESTKTYLPFSSWGITVGVHFNFGGGSSSN